MFQFSVIVKMVLNLRFHLQHYTPSTYIIEVSIQVNLTQQCPDKVCAVKPRKIYLPMLPSNMNDSANAAMKRAIFDTDEEQR